MTDDDRAWPAPSPGEGASSATVTLVDDAPSAEMEALRLRRLRAAFRDGTDADAARRSPLARGLVAGALLAGLLLLGSLVTGVVQRAIDDAHTTTTTSVAGALALRSFSVA